MELHSASYNQENKQIGERTRSVASGRIERKEKKGGKRRGTWEDREEETPAGEAAGEESPESRQRGDNRGRGRGKEKESRARKVDIYRT